MRDKLKLIVFYKKIIYKYAEYHLQYPKRYYSLKDLVENTLFGILRSMYVTNEIHDSKVRLQRKEVLAGEIQYLNYLLSHLVMLKIMSDKQYKSLKIELESFYQAFGGWVKCDLSN